MILLRAGKRQGAGSTPASYSETRSPLLATIRLAPARGAPPGSRGRFRSRARATVTPAGVERASVGLAVDPTREPADDDEPGARASSRPSVLATERP